MQNVGETQIGELVSAQIDTITPGDSVTAARRRMESQTTRSLIVVEQDRPVGIVQWRGLTRAEGDQTVGDVMVREFPVLRTDMTVTEARGYLTGMDVDFDHLPVVDGAGALIGEVQRGAITKSEGMTTGATEQIVSGPDSDRSDNQTVRLVQGMKVRGAAGKDLGTVDQVELSSEGRIAHFTVKYGMLGRKSKRLPADVIRAVDGETVTLSLDQMEFKMLADVGETVV
jgi:CBS-domain-containing membrane protein